MYPPPHLYRVDQTPQPLGFDHAETHAAVQQYKETTWRCPDDCREEETSEFSDYLFIYLSYFLFRLFILFLFLMKRIWFL